MLFRSQKHMGGFLARNPELTQELNYIIDFSLTPQEFEAKWAAMLEKYDVVGHKELAALYAIRKTWVPCYFQNCFFPFLQSTQCSEGFNAVLKRYVNPHNSILNFVKQYQKIQVHILVKEGVMITARMFLNVGLGRPTPSRSKHLKCTLATFTTGLSMSLKG